MLEPILLVYGLVFAVVVWRYIVLYRQHIRLCLRELQLHVQKTHDRKLQQILKRLLQ